MAVMCYAPVKPRRTREKKPLQGDFFFVPETLRKSREDDNTSDDFA